jgi:hypothetical protein
MNAKVALLLVGLLIGALVGYLTRPEAAEISIGPVSIEIQGNEPAGAGGGITSGQGRYIAIIAAIGALAGLGLGFVVGNRRG